MWKHLALTATLCCLVHEVMSNNPPSFIDTGSVSKPEDWPTGSTLFNLSATDPDGDTLSFAIPSPTTSDLVRLGNSHTNGNIKTREIILIKELDRDYDPGTRNLVFTVTDGIYTSTASILLIIIDVNDESPRFRDPGYRVTLTETAGIGTKVITVSATDPDTSSGGQVYYGLKIPDDDKHTFAIDKLSGKITLKQSLDFEDGIFFHKYNVNAWDDNPDEALAGNHADPVSLFVTILDVQDTPPVFWNLPYSHTISEIIPVGSFVLQVYATDGDFGHRNPIQYSFAKGDADSASFIIDRTTGFIFTAVELDADSIHMKQKGGVLSFRVNASEVVPPGQVQFGYTSSLVQVNINVDDINDKLPTFSYLIIHGSISENAPNGSFVTLDKVLMVQDNDRTSTNNQFDVFVTHSGDDFPFEIVLGNCQPTSHTDINIRVNNSNHLDYKQQTSITFQLEIQERTIFPNLFRAGKVVCFSCVGIKNEPLVSIEDCCTREYVCGETDKCRRSRCRRYRRESQPPRGHTLLDSENPSRHCCHGYSHYYYGN